MFVVGARSGISPGTSTRSGRREAQEAEQLRARNGCGGNVVASPDPLAKRLPGGDGADSWAWLPASDCCAAGGGDTRRSPKTTGASGGGWGSNTESGAG